VNEWLERAGDSLAEASGVAPETLRLTAAEGERLLELASHAAHESGARLNAPLVCYLAGRAAATGTPLARLVEAITQLDT
jgi:hypothetical protein